MDPIAALFMQVIDAFRSIIWGPNEATIRRLASRLTQEIVSPLLGYKLTDSNAKDIRSRAQEASSRIQEASQIIAELQSELQQKSKELDHLMDEVVNRQQQAAHWSNLATANEEQAASFVKEMERRIAEGLRSELKRGKRQRQIIAAVAWLFTLVVGGLVGAVLGVWAQQYWQTGTINLLPPTPTVMP